MLEHLAILRYYYNGPYMLNILAAVQCKRKNFGKFAVKIDELCAHDIQTNFIHTGNHIK